MLLLPLLGALFSLTLWGTFFHVPGFIDPSENLLGRLSGAMRATTVARGVYDVVELISTLSAGPGHKPVKVERTYLPSPGPVGMVELPAAIHPGMHPATLSSEFRLLDEVIGDVFGLLEASAEPATSSSPPLLPGAAMVVAAVFLAFVWLFRRGPAPDGAHTLGGLSEDSLEVARCLVVDGAPSPYEEVVALVESSMSSPHSGGPDTPTLTEGSCTIEEPEVNGAVDEPTETAQDASDVTDSSSVHVQTPTTSENYTDPLVIDGSKGCHPAEQSDDSSGAEGASTPASHRRKPRPSRAKRLRRQRRALRELQEEASAAAFGSAAALHPEPSAHPVPPQSPGPEMAYNGASSYGQGYEKQYGGPPLVPMYPQHMYPPPHDFQYIHQTFPPVAYWW